MIRHNIHPLRGTLETYPDTYAIKDSLGNTAFLYIILILGNIKYFNLLDIRECSTVVVGVVVVNIFVSTSSIISSR